MTDVRHRHLHDLLTTYRPSTDLEAGHVRAVLDLLDHPDAFARDHYQPGHITASAFVVHPDRDAIALVEHIKLGRWLQPGGHVEPEDADVLSAARREAQEEIGLGDLASIGVVDVDVHLFPARGRQPQHLHLDVRHGFVARETELRVSEESTGARWADLTEVFEMEESLGRPARRLASMSAAGTLRRH